MRKPNNLKRGDTVAIVSTARKITRKELDFSINLFESWGFNVVLGESIGAEHFQYAGTDALRIKDFQKMLDDSKINAIICARGGYGTVRILDGLDFTQFMLSPKWIVGYSDVTILHTHINTYLHVATLHASMPINFEKNTSESLESIRKVLFGEKLSYEVVSHQKNKIGDAEGEIVGGNLSILYSILGTKSGFNPDHKILFIEDLDEMLYHIDRMVSALKRAGKFNKLKALIVGGMTDMRDTSVKNGFKSDNPFGKTAIEIIEEHTAAFDFPVCYEFPAGHLDENLALAFGGKVKLSIQKNKTIVKFT